MKNTPVVEFCYERIQSHTDNLSQSYYLGHFQFGKLYHGEINYVHEPEPRYITVKVWDTPKEVHLHGDNHLKLMLEVVLLRHERVLRHPGMVKLSGFCSDGEHVAAIYELKALDSVYNLIPKDDFTWLQRIKVALGLASLLRFLHTGRSPYKPFRVRNLNAAHILVEEDYSPKLCDFGMISGGILPDRTNLKNQHVCDCNGCINFRASYNDKWSHNQDVFAFGVILMGLISKRVYTLQDSLGCLAKAWEETLANIRGDNPDNWKLWLVHPNLEADPDFCPADGIKLMDVVVDCTTETNCRRPTMKQILRSLLKLEVVEQHADFLEVKKYLDPFGHGRSENSSSDNSSSDRAHSENGH